MTVIRKKANPFLEDLTDNEKLLAKIIAFGINVRMMHQGETHIVSNPEFCKRYNEWRRMAFHAIGEPDYQLTPVKFRFIVKYIRRMGLVNCLCANHRGYFVANKRKQVDEHIDDLKSRIASFNETIKCLEQQRDEVFPQTTLFDLENEFDDLSGAEFLLGVGKNPNDKNK